MNIGFKSESIPVKIRMKKGANITEEDKNQSDVTQQRVSIRFKTANP